MANTQHLKHASNFELPPEKQGGLGQPIEELKSKDYSTLSSALLKKGEFRLLHGDRSGLDYFDMALKLDPSNPRLYLDQGLALFEYGSRDGQDTELSLASKRFKVATTLDPTSFEGWHLWGNTLYFLGKRKNEPSYFNHAREKYEKALSLIKGQPSDILADLYWDYADLWGKLAEASEEATDYLTAIKAYDQATEHQDDLPAEFWMNFAHAYYTVGGKTNDLRFFVKAINCYKNAISINISSSEGWYKLAVALQTLYSYTHDEDHFSQASECFSTASQLSGSHKEVYLSWAKLLLEAGFIFRDVKKLRSCIEKCHRAHRCDNKDPYIFAIWAEALAYLGTLTDKLELLSDAQNKIEPLVEQYEDPEILYSYGMVLNALGTYYKDVDYYYQAAETFQEGLSLNRAHDKLWYAMASSTYSAAVIDDDEKSFERACRFFERALGLKVTSTTHCHYAICLSKYADFLQDQKTFEQAIYHFEQALGMQKNAAYLHPDWLFHFAITLDHVAGFIESDAHYMKSLDLLNHILMVNPEFPRIHYQLAIVYSHYGELTSEVEIFHRAIHHYRIAHQKEKENDQIILDWSLTLVNLGDLLENNVESDQYFREAEYKMIQAAKLGNVHAYYSLACLYSLLGELDGALRFLEKAAQFDGLPPVEEILEDEWLENARETEGFNSFLAELESRQSN